MTTPYGQPGYGAPAAQPHPRGTAILILGIIGIVICFPCGIIALVMGNNALKQIDANPGAYTNRGTVNAGRILGVIAVVIWVVGLILRYTVLRGN